MKNSLCPACNAKLDFSKICKCIGCTKCRLYYYCDTCCSDNGFCLALHDSCDFHIRHYQDKRAVIYYLENHHYKYNSIQNIIINNYQEAYKILVNYKTNMVFL